MINFCVLDVIVNLIMFIEKKLSGGFDFLIDCCSLVIFVSKIWFIG